MSWPDTLPHDLTMMSNIWKKQGETFVNTSPYGPRLIHHPSSFQTLHWDVATRIVVTSSFSSSPAVAVWTPRQSTIYWSSPFPQLTVLWDGSGPEPPYTAGTLLCPHNWLESSPQKVETVWQGTRLCYPYFLTIESSLINMMVIVTPWARHD